MDTDPFKVGTNSCCAAHTAAGMYKGAMNAIRSYEAGRSDCDVVLCLRQMEDAYKAVLTAGYELCRVYGQIYVLEAVE